MDNIDNQAPATGAWQRYALLAWAAVGALGSAAAEPVASVTTDNVRATLELERTALVPGSTAHALLTLDIREGWHTYWKNPGDSGEATRIDWSLPAGINADAIQWPAPSRIPYSGFVNFGYEGTAYHLVPLQVDEQTAQGSTTLIGEAIWLVCEDICIPETGRFELTVDIASQAEPRADAAARFNAARALLPSTDITATARTLEGNLELAAPDLVDVRDAYFFPDDWGLIEPSAEQRIDGATLQIPGVSRIEAAFGGVLTAIDAGGAAVAYRLRAQPAAAASGTETALSVPPTQSSVSVPTALWFAFLGGLILNLMPCVFPVLSMKALHLISADNGAAARRREGLAYTAGVLVFFAVLGVGLLALRATGTAVGWGFQLQSPPVVGTLAVVMFLIGLNLLGAFEIGGRWMNAGSDLAGRSGLAGSFFTGALAAVVATPCTAPFMGVALGFALTQSAPVALTVLLTLGVGLAAPFLLIALLPALAQRLPRPGAWMTTLRQALAFPMFGAAVWLVWVLTLQAGANGLLRLLTALVLAAFVVWLLSLRGRVVSRVLATLGAVATVFAVATIQPDGSGSASANFVADKNAEPFSVDGLATARAAGSTVFVNQTAAWCLTCLVNEKNVLSTGRVASALAAPNTIYMSGDWTRRDPQITAFLAEHGRSGVPLYVVYHGNAPGRVLPPVLTESIVLDALAR